MPPHKRLLPTFVSSCFFLHTSYQSFVICCLFTPVCSSTCLPVIQCSLVKAPSLHHPVLCVCVWIQPACASSSNPDNNKVLEDANHDSALKTLSKTFNCNAQLDCGKVVTGNPQVYTFRKLNLSVRKDLSCTQKDNIPEAWARKGRDRGRVWKRHLKSKIGFPNLFIIFWGGAQDSEFRAAGFGFGRFTGIEERLDERFQMLPFLMKKAQQTICICYMTVFFLLQMYVLCKNIQ